MLKLTPGQVTAATLVGVEFRPASPGEVHRLAMKRKIFQIDGAPVTAARDGVFFETAATLEQLIADAERQQRDLAVWEASPPAPVEAPPKVEAEPLVTPARVKPEPVLPDPTLEVAEPANPVPEAPLVVGPDSAEQLEVVASQSAMAAAAPSTVSNTPARAASAVRQPHRRNWMTAGAERRGRAAQHWSGRRK
ncbi:hypothetical protein [Paracraurococcus lichenis]|uniref:Uncharacterized protein n=1 Tax=Paracraurococcus lichenis TaxID=3064888 RepID=A0ABT9EBW5_9PROT|nr:hypothetical protein [Paracraurococcus sp. LOR1-02]MDO9713713.1 hypothetical protein [Paracraurococcus sp. LOR1-02]